GALPALAPTADTAPAAAQKVLHLNKAQLYAGVSRQYFAPAAPYPGQCNLLPNPTACSHCAQSRAPLAWHGLNSPVSCLPPALPVTAYRPPNRPNSADGLSAITNRLHPQLIIAVPVIVATVPMPHLTALHQSATAQ